MVGLKSSFCLSFFFSFFKLKFYQTKIVIYINIKKPRSFASQCSALALATPTWQPGASAAEPDREMERFVPLSRLSKLYKVTNEKC